MKKYMGLMQKMQGCWVSHMQGRGAATPSGINDAAHSARLLSRSADCTAAFILNISASPDRVGNQ